MAQRKPYNPNTKYGRRKRREQADKYYDNLSPAEKSNFDTAKFIILFVITAIMLTISYVCSGQDAIPKKANTIIVKGVAFIEAANKLLDLGYIIETKDNDLQTIKTVPKAVKKYSTAQMYFHIRVKDSSAIIRATAGLYKYGTFTQVNLVYEGQVSYGGMKGSAMRITWDELNAFALSFNKPVEYRIEQ